MIAWERRPLEISNLLNPAFCGEILCRCINNYQQFATFPFPYELAFLTLPIVLHKRTREAISLRQRQLLHPWLQLHPAVKVGFAERATALVPFTREALIFLLQVEAITIDDLGQLAVVSYKKSSSLKVSSNAEIVDCYRKAEVVGKWFAQSGTSATIYTMWGVKP